MLWRMSNPAPTAKASARPAHLGWRLLALLYDTVVSIALLFTISALSLALKPDHQPVQPGSLASYLVFAAVWAGIGLYATASWRRGGQTIGMKPWRLKVVAADGGRPDWRALLIRYAVASLSLGAALLWSLIDGERRGLHDLAAGTAFVRLDARSA